MERTKNEVLCSATLDYIKNLDTSNGIDPDLIEAELLDAIRQEFEIENSVKPKNRQWQIPQTLTFAQIADIMAELYPICKISCAGENADADYDLLAIYQTDGENEGVYVTSEDAFRSIAKQFNYNLTQKEFNEIMVTLRGKVPRKTRCTERDLIAVNNGIFDYESKQLLPFTPDKVFMTKSHVNYNPSAVNPIIHNDGDATDWDVESWMESLSDDQEIINVLWEILGAIIRPNVRWNKSAWLYSERGNNGKGTLCELMRQLCGSGAYASIPIADFGRDFLLEPLTRASAIIVDENDVGSFIDHAANLKAVITNDVIQINRKFKMPIAYQFYGFMVQCLNEFPRIKDKSDSFYRRQLFIPFEKCFTGHERRYIKDDYLHRPEVLEYVMYKVLNMNFYTLSEPDACKNILNQYKEYNDPVRQYFEEMSPLFVWDLLPFGFLYELYKAWFKKNSPSGSPQGKKTFIKDIVNITETDDTWYCQGQDAKIKSAGRMDKPELLIAQYGLTDWQNINYKGSDINQICRPALSQAYRGLQRYTSGANLLDANENETNENETNTEE